METTVFISHQKRDKESTKTITEYSKEIGVKVYFDEYDRELQRRMTTQKAVVNALKKEISNSTHILYFISQNALYSKWVPFEVGYEYNKTNLATLTLKGIKNSDLPDYIKVAPIMPHIYDINEFIENKFQKKYILESRNFSDYKSTYHPLSGMMDTITT